MVSRKRRRTPQSKGQVRKTCPMREGEGVDERRTDEEEEVDNLCPSNPPRTTLHLESSNSMGEGERRMEEGEERRKQVEVVVENSFHSTTSTTLHLESGTALRMQSSRMHLVPLQEPEPHTGRRGILASGRPW